MELTALGLVIVFRSIAPPSPITPTFEGAATAASCSLAEVAHSLPLSHLPHRNQYDRRSLEVKKSNLSIQVASKYIFWQEQLMHERILS